MIRHALSAVALLAFGQLNASANPIDQETVKALAEQTDPAVIEWRRHLHQHPELSNREYETSAYIVSQMKALGLEVETGIAHTGVVAILKGDLPGPTIALRADMDALPVAEQVDLPFASKAIASTGAKKSASCMPVATILTSPC